jgi:hypothetical protein
MTKQTNTDANKRRSRGWSEAMDSDSIASRLAVVDDLYQCWKVLKNAKKIPRLSSDQLASSLSSELTKNQQTAARK